MLKAKDIMSSSVITVRPETSIADVAKTFHDNSISGAPVVDEEGTLIGIITESDLIDQNKKLHIPTVVAIFDAVVYLESLRKFEEELRKMTGNRVKDLYSRNVVTVDVDTPVNEIASIMSDSHFHTIPVLQDSRLVGIVGKDDIVKTMAGFGPS